MPLTAVGVAEIYHHLGFMACGLHLLGGYVDAFGIIVWPGAAAQNDVTVTVAAGGKDGRAPLLYHREKMV